MVDHGFTEIVESKTVGKEGATVHICSRDRERVPVSGEQGMKHRSVNNGLRKAGCWPL